MTGPASTPSAVRWNATSAHRDTRRARALRVQLPARAPRGPRGRGSVATPAGRGRGRGLRPSGVQPSAGPLASRRPERRGGAGERAGEAGPGLAAGVQAPAARRARGAAATRGPGRRCPPSAPSLVPGCTPCARRCPGLCGRRGVAERRTPGQPQGAPAQNWGLGRSSGSCPGPRAFSRGGVLTAQA